MSKFFLFVNNFSTINFKCNRYFKLIRKKYFMKHYDNVGLL